MILLWTESIHCSTSSKHLNSHPLSNWLTINEVVKSAVGAQRAKALHRKPYTSSANEPGSNFQKSLISKSRGGVLKRPLPAIKLFILFPELPTCNSPQSFAKSPWLRKTNPRIMLKNATRAISFKNSYFLSSTYLTTVSTSKHKLQKIM